MSTNYGATTYGSGIYGGRTRPPFKSGVSVIIEIYNSLGAYKQAYVTGHCDLQSVAFSHDESGCRDFKLIFSSMKNIAKNDILKIKLFSSDQYFFAGVVRIVPIAGSTKYTFEYSGQGLNSYFIRMNVGALLSYTNTTVGVIVSNLLDNVITQKSPITKNVAKIDVLNIPVTSATFNYCQISDCLDALKKIANSDGNDYLVGVDPSGEFFFRARNSSLVATLGVGRQGKNTIPNYEPSDEYEARTKYFVLKKDGTYWTTLSSGIAGIDIYEEKLTAPDIDDSDIDTWAAGALFENEKNQRTAQIKWRIEPYYPQLVIADGWIRIFTAIPPHKQQLIATDFFNTGNFGSGLFGGQLSQWQIVDDTLRIVEIAYNISDKEAMRSVTLGAIYPRLEAEIVRVNKKLIDLTISLGV